MKVLVAGIRSALGSRVAELLRTDGHEVVGISRRAGDGLLVADLLDADATRRAVLAAAPDAIVQTVNALPKAGPRAVADLTATAQLRIDGTRNLIAAAREASVERYVAEAYIYGYDTVPVGAPPISEDAPFGAGADGTSHALGVLDSAVRGYGGSTVRCGNFYGPEIGSTVAQVAMLRRRRLPVISRATNVLPYVHIDDAASGVVAALARGRAGEAYNIVADEAETGAAFLRAVASAVGAPVPLSVPRWLFRALAGEFATGFLTANRPISNAKARRDLGWSPAYPAVADGAETLVGQGN